MKKCLTRILGLVVAFVGICCNFCYADVIDLSDPYYPSPSINEPTTSIIIPMIIIGIVIVVIVVASIIILVKSKSNRNKKVNNEK